MGMSASQARLIALTGRMNDIEYQGQQINQQRTTLSSQINELYNSLLDMDVPTPPATSEFTKVVYSGKTGGTKFTVGNVIPTGKNSAGNNTYTVDLAYNMSGHSVSLNSTTANISNASQFLYFSNAPESLYVATTQYKTHTTEKINGLTNLPTDSTKKVLVKMKKSEFAALGESFANNNIYQGNENELILKKDVTSLKDDDEIFVEVKSGEVLTSLAEHCGLNVPEEGEITGDLQNVYKAPVETGETKPIPEGYKTDAQIKANGLYIIENGKAIPIEKQEDLEKYLAQGYQIVQLSSDQTNISIENPNWNKDAGGTGYAIGDIALYELGDDAAVNKIGKQTYEACLEGLRNSFPEFEDLTDNELVSKFYVYITKSSSSTNVPHFIRKDEVGSIVKDFTSAPVYDYDADGTFIKNKKSEGCQIEFDVDTGRIGKIGLDNNDGTVSWVKVTADTVTDEAAYEKAFNDYEYKKYKYDQKQHEINLKTSIIQQEDKSLELKLTRLDNERNAVKTEIDAVKQVTKDNIDSSFKTFNG